MKEHFEKCLKSVNKNKENIFKLLIVAPSTSAKLVENYVADKIEGVPYEVIVNNGGSDFCTQVNLGVENCTSGYFSILEFDDEYTDIFFKNMCEYIKFYPDMSGFLPIVAQVNPHGQFVGFMNDASWSRGVNQHQGSVLGNIDHSLLKNFPNFITSGGVFKTEDFKEVGMFKTKIELTFMLEYFLRATYKDKKFMTMPKLGYIHNVGRKDSLF
jgi:hypothetical protein